jgi:hypothetical protein
LGKRPILISSCLRPAIAVEFQHGGDTQQSVSLI